MSEKQNEVANFANDMGHFLRTIGGIFMAVSLLFFAVAFGAELYERHQETKDYEEYY